MAVPPRVEPIRDPVPVVPEVVKKPVLDAPVSLDVPLVQKTVNKSRGAISRCFEDHKDELQADEGQINVTFTIVSSGKVSVARSDIGKTAVGKCLEARIRALKFPRHRDQEVELTLPFAYQLKR